MQLNNKWMSFSKTETFTDRQKQIALFGKFGHPARLDIMAYLFKIKFCFCGDPFNGIGWIQPTISEHLKEIMNEFIDQDIPAESYC